MGNIFTHLTTAPISTHRVTKHSLIENARKGESFYEALVLSLSLLLGGIRGQFWEYIIDGTTVH